MTRKGSEPTKLSVRTQQFKVMIQQRVRETQTKLKTLGESLDKEGESESKPTSLKQKQL